MQEYKIELPVDEKTLKKLKIGDSVYLTGIIYTSRDEAHLKILQMLRKGEKIPVDYRNGAVYHAGPIMKKKNDVWVMVAGGPTTSARMNIIESEFIEKTGTRVIIGKGGMSNDVANTMSRFNCVYLAFTGGAAVLAAKRVKRVLEVHYLEELGMPEAIWVLEVEDFGPLTVGIDTYGRNLFDDVSKKVKSNLKKLEEKIHNH